MAYLCFRRWNYFKKNWMWIESLAETLIVFFCEQNWVKRYVIHLKTQDSSSFNHLARASFSCVFAFAFWHKEMKFNFLSSIINKTNRQKLKRNPASFRSNSFKLVKKIFVYVSIPRWLARVILLSWRNKYWYHS